MIEWIKSHLVDDVRNAWKWYSVRASAIVAALPVAWLAMPDDFKAAIPGGVVTVMSAVSLLGLLLRTVKQK